MILIKYFKNLYNQYEIINFLLTIIFIVFFATVIDYFNFFSLIYNKLSLPIIISGACFILLKLLSLNFFSLYKLKSVNYVDYYSFVIFFSLIIYKILLSIFENILIILPYKIFLLNTLTSITAIVLIFRYCYLTILELKNREKVVKNVFDLKQLYNDEIPKDIEFILINDEAANYDLLNRDKIINQIANTIINCNNNSKFVMSLKGDWGSGKTTILNIVKQKLTNKNIIFIDNFEPWVYEDTKSLLVAFFDIIMKNINCGFRINDLNKFTKVYLKTLTTNIGYSFDELLENNVSISRIKYIINNYLESNDKKIILVLDNLERCSSENILFILRTIHILFDFNRIIYVLSYDENAMKNHFKSKLDIDYTYLEKMVQLEFTIPKIDENVFENVISQCLNNYLKHSKFNPPDGISKDIIGFISKNIKDLREFKRIINSTFNASFNNIDDLNCIDMFLIETILLKNPDLWNEISTNNVYFVSEDRYVYNNEYIYDSKKYNTDATNYFNNLFKNDKLNINKYKDILCYLFPNVKKYFDANSYLKKEKIEFIPEYQTYIDQKKYRASVLDKRIYNSKYFNVYFNKTENEFTIINKRIKEFIDYINSENFRQSDLSKIYLEMEKVYPGWLEKYTLETFQMNLDNIKKERLLPLLNVIYYSYYSVDNSPLFFQLNARSRVQVIISDIILRLSNEDYNQFIKTIKNDYKNLYLIRELAYWLKPENRHNELVDKTKYETLNSIYKDMITDIKRKKINMYNFENYNRYNMILLFDDEEYMSFIKKKIDKNNLMLLILDCINISTSNYGIGYNFDVEKLEKIYGWEKVKKDIKHCQESDLKNFLVTAIENHQEYKDLDRTNVYYVNNWIDLDNLIIKYLNR